MKNWILPLIMLMMSCNGSLSDEQRKKMRENMALHEIKRVTDAEITEAAYEKGRDWMKQVEENRSDSTKLNSLIAKSEGRLRWIVPGSGNALAMEQQLIEAYIASESGAMQDNVQKIRTSTGESDSLLYTKPVISKMPDGTERLEGVWNLWLSKKELILSMSKK